MSNLQLNSQERFGRRSGRKPEPVDVLEDPVRDRGLDQLIVVHEHRLRRLEQEGQNAREAWREARSDLRRHKERWRGAIADAQRYWQDARADFLKMVITSGRFRHAKAVYERLKLEAAKMRLAAIEAVPICREAGRRFFDARRRLALARLHIEKLRIVRDELAPATIR